MTDQTTPEPLTDVPVEHPLSYKLLADLYERAGIQDPNKFDLDHADLQALFDEIDWQRSERNKTHRKAALADAVTAKAKALMGRRTATLKARAERAEAALAEARELARRWQRDAHKHRKIADSRPGLTQIERAEIRQAATEIEQCSRQLVAEIGPDPAERVETTTVADPEPTYIEISTETPEEAAAPGPAPLTLAQAATALHGWAGDLADGTRTDWPAGHPDIIRGIRAAADWLDARDKYETEARQQATDDYRAAATRAVVDDIMRMRQAVIQAAGPEETPEPAEPTLRDIMAAAYRAGLGIRKFDEYELDTSLGEPVMCREWSITNTHKREIGRLTIRRSHYETFVQLDSRRSDCVHTLTDPAPADILAAAREAGLIGDTDA